MNKQFAESLSKAQEDVIESFLNNEYQEVLVRQSRLKCLTCRRLQSHAKNQDYECLATGREGQESAFLVESKYDHSGKESLCLEVFGGVTLSCLPSLFRQERVKYVSQTFQGGERWLELAEWVEANAGNAGAPGYNAGLVLSDPFPQSHRLIYSCAEKRKYVLRTEALRATLRGRLADYPFILGPIQTPGYAPDYRSLCLAVPDSNLETGGVLAETVEWARGRVPRAKELPKCHTHTL